MKKIDMHVHIWENEADPAYSLSRMEEAGVWGACYISRPSLEYSPVYGLDFEARLNEVLSCCAYAKDRLFPIMWIHPDEENVLEKIKIAVDRGVLGFKIICNNFFVYEEKCLRMLRLIAQLDRPVIFHTGILWDGEVSSDYNRPGNFEALLKIEGLRFSMGHCSWPWVDECIALYGKFMNAANHGDKHAEMFFDMTPGTPEIYREDLLRKLFTLGYDVENNVMFGTDNHADTYSVDWAKQWLYVDGRIMDRLGVSKMVREKMYHENVMRFLGVTNETVTHNAPSSDNADKWYCDNPEVKTIIRKWADKLGLSRDFHFEIEKAMAKIPVSDAITIEDYDCDEPDGQRNLLSALFMCEELERKYAEKGIDEKILLDTLKDISIWLDTWSELKGEMYLGEMMWLQRHLQMKLFRLGRLQFCMDVSHYDAPAFGLKKGDPVIEVHIPADGPMTPEECDASIQMAKEFFKKYYPDYEYRCFCTHSWLLDPQLKNLLSEDSNIIKFQNRFDNVVCQQSDAILRYVFKWNTCRRNLKYAPVLTSFAASVKKAYLSGTQFSEPFGILK